jgi:hypothetical protein
MQQIAKGNEKQQAMRSNKWQGVENDNSEWQGATINE